MNTWRNLPGKARVSLLSLHPRLRKWAAQAAQALDGGERDLFLSMTRYDLAHSLAMARRLQGDPLLWKAALLHDAGKIRGELSIYTRWLYTALELLYPSGLRRLCRRVEEEARGVDFIDKAFSLPRGWRRALFVQSHHGEIAAELLRRRGCSEELASLVGQHQYEPRNERARMLREADDAF